MRSNKRVFLITNCLFFFNSAKKFGGALPVKKGGDSLFIDVRNSIFVNNKATKYGQAILIEAYTRLIRNVTIISQSPNVADHLHAIGKEMSVTNVIIKLEDSGLIRNTMRKDVVALKDDLEMEFFTTSDTFAHVISTQCTITMSSTSLVNKRRRHSRELVGLVGVITTPLQKLKWRFVKMPREEETRFEM